MSSSNHWEPVLRVKLTHRLYTQTRWPCCVAITTAPCQQNMSAAMRRLHSASSGTDSGLRLQAAWAPIEETNVTERTFDPNKYKNNAGGTMSAHLSQDCSLSNTSSPDEMIDIHELPGVPFRSNSTKHFDNYSGHYSTESYSFYLGAKNHHS